MNQIRKIALQIGDAARKLMKQVTADEMSPTATEPGKRYRKAPAAAKFARTTPSFATIQGQLSTCLTKLQKNCHDVPRMLDRPGKDSTVRDVVRIAVESAQILSGIPLLFAALEPHGPETSDGQIGTVRGTTGSSAASTPAGLTAFP